MKINELISKKLQEFRCSQDQHPKYYSKEFLEKLRTKIVLIEVLSNFFEFNKNGLYFKTNCPFHYDKNQSFVLAQNDQHYNCKECYAHGDAITFLMNYKECSFSEAIELLANIFNIEIEHIPRGKLPFFEYQEQLFYNDKDGRYSYYSREKGNWKFNQNDNIIFNVKVKLYIEIERIYNLNTYVDWIFFLSRFENKDYDLENFIYLFNTNFKEIFKENPLILLQNVMLDWKHRKIIRN